MAGLEDIRLALGNTLQKVIPDLRVYAQEPDGLREYPFIVVNPTEVIDYGNQALGSENVSFHMTTTLYVMAQSSEEGWRQVDDYRAWNGARSVRIAIKDNNTLGGVVEYAEVVRSAAAERNPETDQSAWEFACVFTVLILQNQ